MSQLPPPPASADVPLPYAGWWRRVGATIVDGLPIGALFAVLAAAFGTTETTDGMVSFELDGAAAAIYYLVAIAWFVGNTLYLQGTRGQSIGKKLLGFGVYGVETRTPIGMGMTFVRQLAHILDALPCLIGFLFPAFDHQKRTFADMIVGTRTLKV